MEYVKFDNGVKVPILGFGCHHLDDGSLLVETVKNYIKFGARFIETLGCSDNEGGVGFAIQDCMKKGLVKRENLFISTKLKDLSFGYEYTKKQFYKQCENLQLDYIDMFQIRYPNKIAQDWKSVLIDRWRALEDLYKENKIKVIGVSNFGIKHLEFLLNEAEIKPMINQIEIHPLYQQKVIQEYCRKNNILVSSWASLQYGKICYDENLIKLAAKYNKTAAQLVSRWHIENNHITVTRTTKQKRIQELLECFDFDLAEEDKIFIDNYDCEEMKAIWPEGGIDD